MAVTPNTITTENIKLVPREIDFVSRFNNTWDALREIMGIMRPIRKEPGTKLVSSTATVNLQDGNIPEGDEVPLSDVILTPVAFEDLKLEKFRRRVTAEAVERFGAVRAVQKTDDALLNELQGNVMDRFYTFLQTGTLTSTETDFQMAIAMSLGLVTNKFKEMRKGMTGLNTFVNVLDIYRYLGTAAIDVQEKFGIQYLKNFLGTSSMILSSEIPQGTVITTPSDNIDFYYIDPSDGDFQQLGLQYTTYGETPLIGVHAEPNYGRVSGDMHVLMGIKLWAEYLDGIAVVKFGGGSGTETARAARKASV